MRAGNYLKTYEIANCTNLPYMNYVKQTKQMGA